MFAVENKKMYNLFVIDLAKYRLPLFFLILVFVLGATFLAIKYASGYRLDLTNKTLKPTGILVVNSSPEGARVFANGKLLTATNSSLSLTPGKYSLEIKKNGFLPWKKEIVIEKELVTVAD
ncbi:MAG: PEGA domain-containing protein, partial [Microgenomates group bacterium]